MMSNKYTGKFVEGRVVACFRNSSFRVRVEEADKRDASRKHVTTLELAAPGTAEGNRIVNKLWRLPPQSKEARAKRGAGGGAGGASGGAGGAGGGRAPPRGAAQRARAAVSKAARAGDKSEDEEEGAESDSSEEADGAGTSESDEDDVEDEGDDVRVPKLGETLEVFLTEDGEKGGGGGGRSGKKRARGEWVAAEVVRVLRGGSFEVGVPVPAEEESSEEDDVEDERRPTTRKVKYGLDGHDREWRYVA